MKKFKQFGILWFAVVCALMVINGLNVDASFWTKFLLVPTIIISTCIALEK